MVILLLPEFSGPILLKHLITAMLGLIRIGMAPLLKLIAYTVLPLSPLAGWCLQHALLLRPHPSVILMTNATL